MAEPATKVPVKTEEKPTERSTAFQWRPFESLRREIDRIFEDFEGDFWRRPFRRSIFDVEPFRRRELTWGAAPTVDIVEKNDAYEVTAELPGMNEKNIEVKLANGVLTIRGEKQEEKEKKRRTTTSRNAASAPSSATSQCRKASTPTRSRQASRTESSG